MNHFTDPAVQSTVFWVLAHSYPALGLAEFGAAAGVPGIQRNDAIEATQYAIWRYTELDYDAAWAFETPESEAAYYHLLAGANASGGTSADTATIAISAPSAAQTGRSLVGPFTVTTNRTAVQVSTAPSVTVTDAGGAPIDTGAVVDGQALYLDLRKSAAAGSATITGTVSGSAVNGHVVSVPTTPGGAPTGADHAQSIILVAAATATTSADAAAVWRAAVDAPAATQAPTSAGGSADELAATGSAFDGGVVAVAVIAILAGVAVALGRRIRSGG